METRVSDAAIAATNGHGSSAVHQTTDGKSAVDDCDWFKKVAQALHEHKPGTVLYLVTGLGDERLCQRYAAGHVKPPAYFFRALLRSPQGWPWLCGAMEGCEEPWWAEVQDAVRIKRAIENR
jgi:hypothetical protein